MPVSGSPAVAPKFAPPCWPGTTTNSRVVVGGVKMPSLRAFDSRCFERRTLRGVDVRVHVVGRKRLARERRRRRREGLRRPRLLARDVALRDGTLLDRPERRPRHAVEHVQHARLAGLGHDVHHPAVVADREQLRRGHEVVVPQIVMHELLVPQALAGARIEGQQAVAEQVGADAVAAVEIERRRSGREVDDAARHVDRDLAPGVGAADVLPGVLRPGVVAELARTRNGVERPHQRAACARRTPEDRPEATRSSHPWPSRG